MQETQQVLGIVQVLIVRIDQIAFVVNDRGGAGCPLCAERSALGANAAATLLLLDATDVAESAAGD